MCLLFENDTLSSMTKEQLELPCVCNLVRRQTLDVGTHCIGSVVPKSAITNMVLMGNFEFKPDVSDLYLLKVVHKK